MAEDLAQIARGGIVVVVASRDDEMRPEIARAWGPVVAPDAASVTICVVAARDSQFGSNLASNGAIAMTMGAPTTYQFFQLKGRVTAIADPTAEQVARAQAHAAAFAEAVLPLGLTREQGLRLFHPDLLAVSFDVHERFDQTPGPGAGARV
jgi:Pyridoxamine 5'-phosphate oxidase